MATEIRQSIYKASTWEPPLYDTTSAWDNVHSDPYLLPREQLLYEADSQHFQFLSFSTETSEVPVVVTNFDKITIDFLQRHAEAIATRTLDRTGTFVFTPAQRAAIFSAVIPVDRDVQLVITVHEHTRRGPTRVRLVSPVQPSKPLHVMAYGTGMGKTAMAIAAAALATLCDEQWKYWNKHCISIMRTKLTSHENGMYEGVVPEEIRIARLFAFFVPTHVMVHWTETCDSMQSVFEERYGKRVEVWKGRRMEYSIQRAYDLTSTDPSKCIFWFLRLDSDSMDVLTSTPEIAIVGQLFDENIQNQGVKKGNPMLSPCLGPTLVSQATLETIFSSLSVRRATHMPIATYSLDALGWITPTSSVGHARKFLGVAGRLLLLCASPVLRKAVTLDALERMPFGLRVLDLPCRNTTLNARFGGSDVETVGLRDLMMAKARTLSEDAYRMVCHAIDTFCQFHLTSESASLTEVVQICESAQKKVEDEQTEENEDTRAARHYVTRLCRILREQLNNESCCAVCFEDSSMQNMRITVCCTLVLCQACVNRLVKCPQCKNSLEQVSAGQPDVPAPLLPTTFTEGLAQLGKEIAPCTRALVQTVQLALKKDSRARILMYFAIERHSNLDRIVTSLRKEICQPVTIINFEWEACFSYRSAAVVKKYNRPDLFPEPMILFCSTRERSKSIVGTQFQETTTIICGGAITNDQKRQLVGRVMRMSNTPKCEPIDMVHFVYV